MIVTNIDKYTDDFTIDWHDQMIEHQTVFDQLGFPLTWFLAGSHGDELTASTYDIESAKSELQRFHELQYDWDYEGAFPIDERAIEAANNALNTLAHYVPIPDITPNVNGTVSMEWETDSGYAHLEFGNAGYSFLVKRDGAIPQGSISRSVDPYQIAFLGMLVNSKLFSQHQSMATIQNLNSTM